MGSIKKEDIARHDVIINLAGENIGAKRWSKAQKQKIIGSRVDTSRRLAAYCAELGPQAPRLFNASAIGVYGLQATVHQQWQCRYDEDSRLPSPAGDFVSEVGSLWEAQLLPAEQAGVNVVKLRFGVVLAKQGGALAKMLPAFRVGLGTVLGSGRQPVSWVALDDVVSAIEFLLERPELTGAFNIVADEVVDQRKFADTLAKVLARPRFLAMPAPMVKLLFGQMGDELVLNGQVVNSKRLGELGFTFRYGELQAALQHSFKTDR